MTIRLLAAAGVASSGALLVGGPASAAPSANVSVQYTAAAAAPVMQITEDEPTSQFHPEGEGDYGYTLATANPGAATALAAVAWPGSAAGNAGTLVSLLGGPTVSALNDPVQASAASGTSQTHSSVSAPSGSTMSASVEPTGPDDQHSTATSTLAGGGLGAEGAVGNSSSNSTVDFNNDTSTLTVTATSKADDIDAGGVVKIGSVTSSASAISVGGGIPKLTGATDFHNMSVAGQAAYVDGSGVHLGSPGAPAGPAEVAAVDAALQQTGMEVYFTAPHTITVGGTAYYYAASVLFYWVFPDDSSHNSLTMTLGGSGVSMTDSASSFSMVTPAPTAGGVAVAPANPSPPASSAVPVGTVGSDGGAPTSGSNGGTSLSLPASPAAAISPSTSGGQQAVVPAGVSLPGDIGVGWWILAAAAALVGAALTTRVPGLLDRRAATVCPRQRAGGDTQVAKDM